MENILNTIISNIYVSVFLALCTVIGIPLSLLLNYKNKQKKILSISERTIELIKNNDIEKLQTKFDNTRIQSLYKTEFIIWNNGNTCLRKEDMAGSVHVDFGKETIVLKSEIISVIDESNKIGITNNENSLDIDFDYLKRKQGAKIVIFHSGKNSNIITKIKMKEGKSVVEKSEFSADIRTKKGVNLEPIFGLVYILIASFIPVMMTVQIIQNHLNNIETKRLPLCISCICVMTLGIIGLLIGTVPNIINEFKIGIPKEIK